MTGAYTSGNSALKNKKGGLIQNFMTFDSVANRQQKAKMIELRERLGALSSNPLKDLSDRFKIAKEIFELRRETDATLTHDQLMFNGYN